MEEQKTIMTEPKTEMKTEVKTEPKIEPKSEKIKEERQANINKIIKQEKEIENVAEENQYVTFTIGEETYGVEVLKVQEIIGMVPITNVPNSLAFMKGVINLRGSVVPVVDMRIKFGMEERPYDEFTVIVIVEVNERLIGMIVDTVSDVANIPISSIQETPHFAAKVETDFIKGIGQKEEQLVIILDVDKILTVEELQKMKNN